MKFSSKILSVSVVAALGLAACGGSDSTDDSTPVVTEAVADDANNDDAAAADEVVDAESEADIDAGAGSDIDEPELEAPDVDVEAGEALEAEEVIEPDEPEATDAATSETTGSVDGNLCERIANVNDVIDRLDASESLDEDTQLAAFEDLVASLDAVAEVAPGDAAADAMLLAEGFRALADFGAGGAEPTPEQIELLDSPEYEMAGEQLENFALAECGIELG